MNLAARSPCVAPHASGVFEVAHPVETGVCHQVSADSLRLLGVHVRERICYVRTSGRRATAAKRNVVREHSHREPVVDRNDDRSAS